jgi:hypothetical protein
VPKIETYPVYAWSVNEQLPILEKIFKESGIPDRLVHSFCEQTFARALEDVFIIDCTSDQHYDQSMEHSITQARMQYLRSDGEINYTLEQDVGYLFSKINSSNIPFECSVLLRRGAILFFQREEARKIRKKIDGA